jgi:hypothetical protein
VGVGGNNFAEVALCIAEPVRIQRVLAGPEHRRGIGRRPGR